MNGTDRRCGYGMRLGVGVVVALLLVGAVTAAHDGRSGTAKTTDGATFGLGTSGSSPLTITNLVVNPNPVSQNSQFSVSVQVSGGAQPYSYSWGPLPGGCSPGNTPSWQCSISSPGQYSVSVQVTDNNGTQTSDSQQLTVTSSSGNGQGNGHNGSSNGNGSNPFNLSAFGPVLFFAFIGAVVGFILLIALTIGVIMIAVILARRLPRQPRGKLVCPACQAKVAAGSKFCSTCAAPIPPAK